MKNLNYIVFAVFFFAFAKANFAQSAPEEDKTRRAKAEQYLAQAQTEANAGDLVEAEALYRRAEALDKSAVTATYNRGVLYDKEEMGDNAGDAYGTATKTENLSKAEKHRIYHNLGNKFLEKNEYAAAVKAYKEALRNDPTDDETRYNLALAKQEEDKQSGGEGDDNKEQQQQQDRQDGGGEEQQEQDKSDSQDGKDPNQKPKDGENEQQDQGDQKEGENESDPEQKGENPQDQQGDQKDQGSPEEPKENGQPQPIKGKISQQQMRRLLQRMAEEEARVQEKLNKDQQKANTKKVEKDW